VARLQDALITLQSITAPVAFLPHTTMFDDVAEGGGVALPPFLLPLSPPPPASATTTPPITSAITTPPTINHFVPGRQPRRSVTGISTTPGMRYFKSRAVDDGIVAASR
jgi:hypothetical protein